MLIYYHQNNLFSLLNKEIWKVIKCISHVCTGRVIGLYLLGGGGAAGILARI